MSGGATDERAPLRQEAEGTPVLLITGALLVTVMFSALLIGTSYFLLRGQEARLRPSGQFDEKTLRVRPRVSEVLQEPFTIPHARPSLRAQQQEELDRFGWIDRRRRIVHIPIDEAMKLVADRAQQGGGP